MENLGATFVCLLEQRRPLLCLWTYSPLAFHIFCLIVAKHLSNHQGIIHCKLLEVPGGILTLVVLLPLG
jgi:hypothetical protein